ncbi:MAG: response regulator transcription factor [Alphaproteobacteria bacterium]|nr:response regulator transcription factor [Alphaproteobacteria bacterium]
MRVLLVEDDPAMAKGIELMLKGEGMVVDTTSLGEDGLEIAKIYDYDIILLDLILPDMDGYEVLRRLRAARVETPVLILSGMADTEKKVKGLGSGADDYLVKPYAFAELLARIEALARRQAATPAEITTLRVEDLVMDLLTRTVSRSNHPVELQPREFKLLEFLMRHAGQVVTRTMLLENVWDYHFDPQTNLIDVHISRLRQKVDKGFEQPLIHTVRGAGYMLRGAS